MKNTLYIALVIVTLVSLISILYKRHDKANTTDVLLTTTSNFSKKLIDLGDIPLKGNASASFIIHNTGKNKLFIKSVTPDCHCTVSSFSKKAIEPKDSLGIVLKYDSTLPGIFQSSATVETNSKENSTILIMRGNIVKK